MGGSGRADRWGLSLLIALSALFAACSARQPTPPSAVPVPSSVAPHGSVVGVASWYGPGFNGRRTADGEIYNQEDLTAASNIFPLGTRLMVTNLRNHRTVEVRINDRGPFRKHRLIDLSHKAARILGITKPGTALVRMDVLSAPKGSLPAGERRYFVQVGAFTTPDKAEHLFRRLSAYYPDVRMDELDAGTQRYYRVRMGSFATRGAAEARAARTGRFGLPVVIVRQ